jgi:hypothetical protein
MAVTLPSGLPLAGGNCQANAGTTNGNSIGAGKISGRGSTLQSWLQFDFTAAFTGDVCGSVAKDTTANTYTPPACGTAEPAGDPTDPSSPIDQCVPNPVPPTYGADGMVAYNYPAAQDLSGTGSGEGEVVLSCRDDAFAGTDLPYSNPDIQHIDGTDGAEATGQTTGSHPCVHTGWVSPFQANGSVGGTDPAGQAMSIPIGVSAIALPVNLPTTCYVTAPPTGGLTLTTNDVLGLWGGTVTNWNQLTDIGSAQNFNAAGCNFPVVRVVRKDGNSGTSQGFLNYTKDANASLTTQVGTCAATEPSGTSTIQTGSFSQLDLNANGDQGYSGENSVWPGNQNTTIGTVNETGCSYVVRAGTNGGPFLLHLLDTIDSVSSTNPGGTQVGAIGYADLSDVVRDPGDQAGLVIPQITNSTGGTSFPSVATTSANQFQTGNASNCTFNGGANAPALPASGVGLSNAGSGSTNSGDWSLDGGTGGSATTLNPSDDIAWTAQGSSYPICSLTWDFVWAGEDGNNTARTSGTQRLPTSAQTLVLASIPAGTATSGVAEIRAPNQLITYNGISGNTLQNVSGGFGNVLSNAQVLLPNATGGTGTGTTTAADTNPEPELNANQRRTLYQYFSYVLSDPAQSTAASAGYAQLPESWLNALRSQFQAAY